MTKGTDMDRSSISRALPAGLRRWLRFHLLRRDVELEPVRIDRADARSVAVLAPHPDDDVIGCGGTLRKHRLAGDEVTVIYLTDGARGDDVDGPPSAALAETRRQEAEEAARLLGVERLVFLGYTDGELPVTREAVDRVGEAIEASGAGAVFLPFLLDAHPDHVAANRIFAGLSRRIGREVAVYAYEVWTPLTPNRLVDISSVAAVKEAAIRSHASQMRNVDYAEPTLGLNRYRSMAVADGQGVFEAFFCAGAAEYGRLVEAVLGR